MSSGKAAIDISIDINRYKIISKIGEGGFSQVYRVKDLQTNKYYAAKISNFMIDDETKENQETLLLFREVNLMSLLNHPNILEFVGYYSTNFEEDPVPTIITELATNGSLRDIISMEMQGLAPDDWDYTKKLINIYGIASGMSYLHSHNILHRDLKPENILMNDYLQPKISDFGLSKITDFLSISMNIQSQKGLKGTPTYMAPEIISSEKYSKSSDVYSFAFIVFEIFTCEEPFKNVSFFQLMKKVMNDGFRPKIKEDVPQVYREMIERCWSQDPSERPSFDEIVTELKTNSEFITELVDELEFYDYVEFIDNYQITFDVSKRAIHFEDFIKAKGRNKNIKRVLINEIISKEEEKTTEIKDEEETNINLHTSNIQKADNNKINSQKIIEDEISLHKTNDGEIGSQKVIEDEEKETKVKENDFSKQFENIKSFIEGKNGILKNTELGIFFIEQLIDNGYNDALVYYIKILIKGKFIPKNRTKAIQYISKLFSMKDKRFYLVQGILSRKKNQFNEALQYFEEGSKLGEPESKYQYSKMLFLGEGVKRNEQEAIKYLNQSKELGYEKSGRFLTAYQTLKNIKEFTALPAETQIIFITLNIKNNFDKIFLSPKKTEKLFFNKSLKSPNLFEYLKLYKSISIEVEYSSSSFKSIIDLLIKIKKKNA